MRAARSHPPASPRPFEARLVPPSPRWRDSFIAALEEGFRRGSRSAMRPREIARVRRGFDRHLNERTRQTGEIILPGGRRVEGVPVSLFWLVAGEVFIGEMSFRHRLNDYLRLSGGHVGYGVRPGLMGQGFGKRLLALGKEEARATGLANLLVTCHDDNPASARVIEANGGVLEDVVDDIFGGGPLRRYWIALAPRR
jgi:predicted acetyltransferase